MNLFHKLKHFNVQLLRELHPQNDDVLQDQPMSRPGATQVRILDCLLEHAKDGVSQHQLENELDLSAATISGVLDTMESRGLIRRVADQDDLRSKKIIMTPDAEAHFKSAQHEFGRIRAKATQNLSARELRNFEKTLDKMIANLEEDEE